MALFNYATKEITLKIVYYGPGLSGKTTNIQHLHSILAPDTKGKLLSLATEADRTLFFDFLPVELGKIREFSIRFQLYTVPGQVRYNATRKIVLKGADAVVFVADSQTAMKEQNIESLENMRDNLRANNINPDDIPVVLQYNKRDLKNIMSSEELNADLNQNNYDVLEASALKGTGVDETFKLITKLLLKDISRKHKIEIQQPPKGRPAEPPSTDRERQRPLTAPASDILGSNAEIASSQPVSQVFDIPGLSKTAASQEASTTFVLESTCHTAEHTDETETVASQPEPELEDEVFQLEDEDEIADRGTLDTSKPLFTEEPLSMPSGGISERFNGIDRELDRIISALSEIQTSYRELQDSVGSIKREIGLLKDMRNDQKEIIAILSGVLNIVENVKEKKTWFKL